MNPPRTQGKWTPRDREILRTLTQKVPVLTLKQVARAWWTETSTGINGAQARLRKLERDGLVTRARVMAHSELSLAAPIVTWTVGKAIPDMRSVSSYLRSRWRMVLRPTTVVVATAQSARRMGGHGGDLQHETHLSHDLHMGTIYLHLLRTDPDAAAAWMSEAHLARRRRHQKLPDAALVNRAGQVTKVIEFGGAYDVRHLQSFHEDCVARQLPYELW